MFLRQRRKLLVANALRDHFTPVPLQELLTTSRTFPVTARVDLQRALEQTFGQKYSSRVLGVFSTYSHETLTVAHLIDVESSRVQIAPLQYDEIDMGQTSPARCLKNGLWLARSADTPFAVLLSPGEKFGRTTGVHLQLAVPPGEQGLELARDFFARIEAMINAAGSYRGKVLSLEQIDHYSGVAGAVKVHRLAGVARDQVILPDKTLLLLERNITEFIQQREQLRRFGMPAKKGLLFYGPPGTGKTHTIHYLASQLSNHTTLLITAEQVGLLDEYLQLARFLQPAMVVIEDVDLIARERESMRSACEESLLNKLLNEMDGLREDAEILFVLTTNRPEKIEAALMARPGRVDQAIEFPLPDEEGRRKLLRLYARGMVLSDDIADLAVAKTKGASAAFIKELMRRSAQFSMRNGEAKRLERSHLASALEEMLFSGGSLNRKLLGGEIEQSRIE